LKIDTQKNDYSVVVLRGGLWDPITGHKVLGAPEFIRGSAVAKLEEIYQVVFGSLLLKIESMD
jgi:hypothetical protein